MIILGVRLYNIRSYRDKTIVFPSHGITAIHGDVGTGKSSILLAISYALFGQTVGRGGSPIDRYAYPKGEDLLRLGQREGFVRLLLGQKTSSGDRIIVLERRVRREGDRVRDPGGRLIVYQVETRGGKPFLKTLLNRVYSSEELRVKLLEVLGIPEIRARRGRPLVFTNAIYVPQFAVNDIIGIGDDERLSLINKALNMEKYNYFKNNVEELKSRLNSEIRELDRLVNEYHRKLSEIDPDMIKGEIEKFEKDKEKTSKRIEEMESERARLEKEISVLEEKQKEYLSKKARVDKELGRLVEIENSLERTRAEIEKIMGRHGIKSVDDIEGVVNSLLSELKSKEKAVKEQESRIRDLEGSRDRLLKLIEDREEKIRRYIASISGLKREIELVKRSREEKVRELEEKEGLVKKGVCPVCMQKIPHEHGLRLIEDIRRSIAGIEERIAGIEEDIQRLEKELRNAQSIRDRYREELKVVEEGLRKADKLLRDLEREKVELERRIEDVRRLTELSRLRDRYEKELERKSALEREKRVLEEELKRIVDRKSGLLEELKRVNNDIASLKEKLGKIDGELKELRRKLDEYEAVRKRYMELSGQLDFLGKVRDFITGSGRRRGVLCELVSRVEERVRGVALLKFKDLFTQYFLKLMEDHEIVFVDLDERFKPIVRINTRSMTGEISQPSGGQLTSISLAYRLALNTVARSMSPQLRYSTLILDEPTYGFSPERVEKLRELLKDISKGRQVIVVTHDVNLKDIGDCKIRLEYDVGLGETIVNYEECGIVDQTCRSFVEKILKERGVVEGTSGQRVTAGREEASTKPFKPYTKTRPITKERNILDFIK